MRRRTLLQTTGVALGSGLTGCASESQSSGRMAVSSPALSDGGTIPSRFACDGVGVSPPLTVESTPEATATLAVVGRSTVGVLDNPTFWTLWNVPGDTEEIPEGLPRTETVDALDSARQGTAGDGEPGYKPLCPPPGQSYDHWVQVYAFDDELSLDAGTSNDDAVDTIEESQIASARITASYTRAETPTG